MLLALVVAAGAGLRFWGIGFGLPHDLARPDEEKIASAALGVFQGDLDPHFFLYPSLYIYLTAAGYAVLFAIERFAAAGVTAAQFAAGSISDPSSLRLVARTLSVAAGTATIPALYGAACELFAPRAALTASLFLAVAFLAVRDSHFGVTDQLVALLVVLAFWAAARCASRGLTWRRVALAGLLSGLAASTKYNAALAVAPSAVAVLAATIVSRERRWLAAVGAAVLLAATLGAGFLAATPFAVLDRPAFLADFGAQARTALGSQRGSILDPAREVNGGERGWRHHLTFTLRYGLGLPLLLAAIGGACWLALERSRRAALVLSFPAVYYAAMGMSVLVYARWMVPVVPFLCLTAAVFVDRASDLVGLVLRSRPASALCAAALVVVCAVPTAAHSLAFDRFVARTDARVLAARWVESRFPAGTTIYQTGIFYGQVQPRPSDRYPEYEFNDRHGVFVPRDSPTGTVPELVVVLDSPLAIFNQKPERLATLLAHEYEIIATFQGTGEPDASPADYDQQDAFYVPYAGMPSARRPGPSVRIYKRRL